MVKGEVTEQQALCCGNKPPRCSVVMPVYNTPQEFLRAAVQSVLSQSFTDFELIVVDDCSEPYVKEFFDACADARVRYLRMAAQSGAAVARNRALESARGEFVAFMDADDISLPERFAKQVAFLDAHPEVSCLGTEYKIFDGQRFKKAPAVPHDHEGIVSYLLFCGCAFCQSGVMLRRAVLEQPTPLRYREHFAAAHDCALWFDLIGRARFAILGEVLVHYRVHRESISRRSHALQVRKMAEAQAELLARFGSPLPSAETWPALLSGATLSRQEYATLSRCLEQAADALHAQLGYAESSILPALRQRVRKAFLRTRSVRGQWGLWHMPVRRRVRLSLPWCIFCFVTRGIL